MTASARCRAKGGPANCTDPNCPAKRAQAARMAAFYAHPANSARAKQIAAPVPVAPKGRAMARALEAKLGWAGDKPSWWSAYVTEAQASPKPHEPELLDVLDSPAGKIAVVWHEESPDEHEWKRTLDSGIGLHVLYFKAVESGEILGYLKLSHVTDESFERAFGNDEFTPLRYKERFGGASIGLGYDEHHGSSSRNLAGEALVAKRRELWYPVTTAMRGSIVTEDGEYVPRYMLTPDHTPVSDARIAADFAELTAGVEPEMKAFRKSWVEPLVDFSRIGDGETPSPLEGQGYGTAMYVYAARKLGQAGRRLRASDTQTDAAQALWARFTRLLPAQRGELKVKTRRGKYLIYPTLDFRRRRRQVAA